MSQYYITPTETDISVGRINEVLRNVSTLSISSNSQSNSVISNRGNQFYTNLLAQNITRLNKQPLKFSDFRNSLFIGCNVTTYSEAPSQYGTNNNGSIKVEPFGGKGSEYSVVISRVERLSTVVLQKTFSSGLWAETPRNLNSGLYSVTVSELSGELSSNRSFTFDITITYEYGIGYASRIRTSTVYISK
jgi:hypothetical protein